MEYQLVMLSMQANWSSVCHSRINPSATTVEWADVVVVVLSLLSRRSTE